jgi:uncharacterized protein YbcI
VTPAGALGRATAAVVRRSPHRAPSVSAAPCAGTAFEGMADSAQMTGGELNAAVTSALVGIHMETLGRGPRSASTFHHGPVVVTLMRDVLTPAEKSIAQDGRDGEVMRIRQLFQQTMQPSFREAVERLTGRRVLAIISGNHVDPDIAAGVFVLEQPL